MRIAITGAGGTTTVTFTVLQKTAKFVGGAYNKRTEESVDVDGRVWAWDNGVSTGTDLKAGGFYTLGVSAGDGACFQTFRLITSWAAL